MPTFDLPVERASASSAACTSSVNRIIVPRSWWPPRRRDRPADPFGALVSSVIVFKVSLLSDVIELEVVEHDERRRLVELVELHAA